MTGKLIGAILIIVGCGGFGLSIVRSFKREETLLRQLIAALDYMQCDLQYRLTPLPDLCRQVSRENRNPIGRFLDILSEELESQVSPDVTSCVHAALVCCKALPDRVTKALELLGTSLGRFDVEGQITGLESVRVHCRGELERMGDNRESRLRSYQTLGLCAGAALVILFI